jgi:hypothetical protein
MTDDSTLHAAEERLLDAALAQNFRGATVPRRATSPNWLAAALLLLGLGVVTSVWIATANGGNAVAQQPGPRPLPPEVTGDGKAAIEALPVATENLLAKLVDPRELSAATRLENLRGLRLWPKKGRLEGGFGIHSTWSSPPIDVLQPLTQMRQLEVLALPDELALTPAVLAPLANHPSLRELRLGRDRFTIDEALVATLARIPHLESLHLSFVPLRPDALRRLATLPLRSIAFEYCPGLDASGWQGLLAMRSLQRLAFQDWDWNYVAGQVATPEAWQPSADDLRQLQSLPHLRCLELRGCDVTDEQLAALPDTLTTLHVVGARLTGDGLGALQRFLAVRELVFDGKPVDNSLAQLFASDSETHANAFAAAIRPLRLQSLDYRGAMTADAMAAIGAQRTLRELKITSKQPADRAAAMFRDLTLRRVLWYAPLDAPLLDALASQPELQEFELRANTITDIAALAKAAKLERLTLTQMTIGNGIPAEVLAPLARSPSLREIRVNASITRGEPHPSEADLQRAVGDRIRVLLHESEFTVQK